MELDGMRQVAYPPPPTPTPGKSSVFSPQLLCFSLCLTTSNLSFPWREAGAGLQKGTEAPRMGMWGGRMHSNFPLHPAGRAWGWQEGPPRVVGLACGSEGWTVRGGGPAQALAADPRWSHPACCWRAPLSWEGGLN